MQEVSLPLPGHLLAGVNDPSSVIAGALFCYGVGNHLPGRAQNRIGFLLRFLVTAFLLSRISKQNRLGA